MITDRYKIDSDGIMIFHEDIDENHSDYNAQGLDNLFQEEERHFWFLSRKEFIFQWMKKRVDTSESIIEIGAGTGNVARYLSHKGYSDIAVGEMHRSGLKYARSYGIERCYQFDLLQSPFFEEFNAVCMFDVLEHLDDDMNALANVFQMLTNEGRVILTVPAHQWLWNRSDTVAGHKRRYTKKELVRRLKKAGFDVEVARYFFITLVPLLYLRALLNRDSGKVVTKDEFSNSISMNPVISKLLYIFTKLENNLNQFLPNYFGGSLFVIARKNDSI